MTRNYFLENYNTFSDLIDINSEYGICACDDLYSYEDVLNYIRDEIHDLLREVNWDHAGNILASIPTDCEWYISEGWFEFREANDDDFVYIKNDILEYMDENGYWDEEELMDEDFNTFPLEDEEETPDEFEIDLSLSFDDFFVTSSEETGKILENIHAENEATEQSFESFIACVTSA